MKSKPETSGQKLIRIKKTIVNVNVPNSATPPFWRWSKDVSNYSCVCWLCSHSCEMMVTQDFPFSVLCWGSPEVMTSALNIKLHWKRFRENILSLTAGRQVGHKSNQRTSIPGNQCEGGLVSSYSVNLLSNPPSLLINTRFCHNFLFTCWHFKCVAYKGHLCLGKKQFNWFYYCRKI